MHLDGASFCSEKRGKNMSVPDFPLDVSYLRHGLSHPAYASDPQKKNILVRGTMYTICIFCAEYGTGKWLKKNHCCPWDYSDSKCNIEGVIRLDYAPLWFLVSLFYEHLVD